VGALNGLMTARFKVHPFIGTMATNFILGASALTIMYTNMLGGRTDTVKIPENSKFVTLVQGEFLGLPNILWFALIAVVVMTIVWNKTKFGRNMFAVGCNPEAARVAGVNVTVVTTMVFVVAGILYGYAALFGMASNGGSVGSSTFGNHGLYAIAACVIGGVSFTGGVGKIRGIVFGVLLFQLISDSTGFIAPGNTAIGLVFIGIVVAIAVIFDMLKYRTKQ
ncbi:MAG: beta-methylgalactoside transporter, partial [Firmicutes bacterium]|nr:beta-methylgalactoside transporter [Bacillota bacterium]